MNKKVKAYPLGFLLFPQNLSLVIYEQQEEVFKGDSDEWEITIIEAGKKPSHYVTINTADLVAGHFIIKIIFESESVYYKSLINYKKLMKSIVLILILLGFNCEGFSQKMGKPKINEEISLGLGLPIQRFNYSGSNKVSDNRFETFIDFKYIRTKKKIAWLFEADFAFLRDKFSHLSNPSDIYSGQLIASNLRAAIGYPLKLNKVSILPSVGISQQFILYRNYKLNGKSVESEVTHFPHLLPYAQMLVSYAFTDSRLLGIGYSYQQKIEYPFNFEHPSVLIIPSDSFSYPYFDKIYVFIRFGIN